MSIWTLTVVKTQWDKGMHQTELIKQSRSAWHLISLIPSASVSPDLKALYKSVIIIFVLTLGRYDPEGF